MMTQRAARFLLVTSFVIVAFGLAIHVLVPTRFESTVLPARQDRPLIVSLDQGEDTFVRQAFTLEFSFPELPGSNTTFAIVNGSELERFMSGTAFDDLLPFKTAADFQLHIDEAEPFKVAFIAFPGHPGENLSLLVMTNSSFDIFVSSYYSIIPATYTLGLTILAGGFLAVFAVLTWALHGWKRLLSIGVGINVAIFWLRASLLSAPLGVDPVFADVFTVEAYSDFQFQTFIWTKAIASGVDLYSATVPIAYIFPPLYADVAWLFNLLPLPAWKLALPILTFTILTALLVYKITLALSRDEKRAGIAMLLYLVNPFVLFYGSFVWLTPPMMVFFVMLAFYLAIERKGAWPAVALGIAIASKQYAIVFFPLLVIAMVTSSGARTMKAVIWQAAIVTVACGGTIALASLPYITIDPTGYLDWVFFSNAGGPGQVASLSMFYKVNAYPVTFNSFFFLIGAPEAFTNAIAWVLAYNIPLLSSGAGVYVAFFLLSRKTRIGEARAEDAVYLARMLFYAMLMVLFMHALYNHGTFKYYFILLAPFVSILHDPNDLDLQKAMTTPASRLDWRWLVPTVYMLLIVLCYRYVYLVLVLAWAVYLILKKRGSIDRFTARLWTRIAGYSRSIDRHGARFSCSSTA